MSMLDGVSRCWWLSETCVVNWNAWSAVGTIAAALVALSLGVWQAFKGLREQRSRARWVAIEVRNVVSKWHQRVRHANSVGDVDLYFLLGDEELDPALVPLQIGALRSSLHEIGEAGSPLANAIWISDQIARIPVEKALRGDIADAGYSARHIARYRTGLRALEAHLHQAHTRIARIGGQGYGLMRPAKES